jgi:hypothetical protein
MVDVMMGSRSSNVPSPKDDLKERLSRYRQIILEFVQQALAARLEQPTQIQQISTL